jgi:hypothetical protein
VNSYVFVKQFVSLSDTTLSMAVACSDLYILEFDCLGVGFCMVVTVLFGVADFAQIHFLSPEGSSFLLQQK